MGFHRLNTPTYLGGLPAGYDYINNPSANGDPGSPASADGKKSFGVNQGTYLVAFSEDGTSSDTNRPSLALAGNTDILDDNQRAAQVVIRKTDISGGGSPVASVLLSVNNVYVGSASDSPATSNDQATRNRLVKVVDQNDNEIEVSGTTVVVTLIHDGASNNYVGNVAGGFVNTPTLNFSPSIPAGVNYRLYYGVARNYVDIVKNKAGELVFEQIRTAHKVPGDVQAILRTLHNAAGSGTWNASWDTTINDLRYGGLNRVVNGDSAKPVASPDTDRYPLNTTGAGNEGWMQRLGKSISLYSADAAMYVDPTQALERLVINDTTKSRGSTGLLIEGSFHDGLSTYTGETDRYQAFASFLYADVRRNTSGIHAANPFTRIVAGSSVTLATSNSNPLTGESTVQLPGGQYFRKNTSNDSDIFLGYDLIRIRYTQSAVVKVQDFIMTSFGSTGSPTSLVLCKVRCLDGTVPDFTGASAATVVEWLRWSVGYNEGAPYRSSEENGFSFPEAQPGFTVISPGHSTTGLSTAVGRARFLSRSFSITDPVAEFGVMKQGTLVASVRILSGDSDNSLWPSVDLGLTTLITNALGMGSTFGSYSNGTEDASTITSGTTTQSLEIDEFRIIAIDCDNTVTGTQSIAFTFATITDSRTIGNTAKIWILFTQPVGGSTGGTVDVTWPGTAKFQSSADSHPATGLGALTIWEGTYFNGNWYFTKRAY